MSIYIFLLSLDIIINFIVSIIIVLQIREEDGWLQSLYSIKRYLEYLYHNRNYFGIFISTITLIITLPAIALNVLIQLIYFVLFFIIFIYNLGNKKSDENNNE